MAPYGAGRYDQIVCYGRTHGREKKHHLWVAYTEALLRQIAVSYPLAVSEEASNSKQRKTK